MDKKMWYTQIVEYNSALKIDTNAFICDNRDKPEDIMLIC